jgi:hypothetical protein
VLDGGAGTDICYMDNQDTVRNCEEVHQGRTHIAG